MSLNHADWKPLPKRLSIFFVLLLGAWCAKRPCTKGLCASWGRRVVVGGWITECSGRADLAESGCLSRNQLCNQCSSSTAVARHRWAGCPLLPLSSSQGGSILISLTNLLELSSKHMSRNSTSLAMALVLMMSYQQIYSICILYTFIMYQMY